MTTVPMRDLPSSAGSGAVDRGLLWLSTAGFLGFVALLVTVTSSQRVDTLDVLVAARVPLVRSPTLTLVAHVVTAMGSFPAVLAVTVATVATLGLRTRQLWLPAIMASTVAATASLVTLVKIAVARTRPEVSILLGSPATDFAFPSGHTTNGCVVYVVAALLLSAQRRWRKLGLAVAVAVAVVIGLSRVYLGYHWATDVFGGWLFAVGVIAACYSAARRLGVLPLPTTAVGSTQNASGTPPRPGSLAR